MKVVIDRDGTLEIRPESQFENYALTKWLEDYKWQKVKIRLSRWAGDGEYTKDDLSGGKVTDEPR